MMRAATLCTVLPSLLLLGIPGPGCLQDCLQHPASVDRVLQVPEPPMPHELCCAQTPGHTVATAVLSVPTDKALAPALQVPGNGLPSEEPEGLRSSSLAPLMALPQFLLALPLLC